MDIMEILGYTSTQNITVLDGMGYGFMELEIDLHSIFVKTEEAIYSTETMIFHPQSFMQ